MAYRITVPAPDGKVYIRTAARRYSHMVLYGIGEPSFHTREDLALGQCGATQVIEITTDMISEMPAKA